MPMHARAQRLTRGWIVGLVATTVAAVSHSLAGGYRPGILSFGLALVFAGLLGTAVIGRRPSLPRLVVAVAGSQLAFHLLFSLLGAGSVASSSASMSVSSRMPGMSGMDSPSSTAIVLSGHDHLADPSMWIAHAIAAALTILFLRHAELAVWMMLGRLATLVVGRVTVLAAPVLPSVRPRLMDDTRDAVPLITRVLIVSARRRGPPLPTF